MNFKEILFRAFCNGKIWLNVIVHQLRPLKLALIAKVLFSLL